MAKSRKRRSAGSARKKEQQQKDRTVRDLMDLHIVSGPPRPKLAWEYLAKFNQFEEWILDGERPRDKPGEIPPEHSMMLWYWPESFEVYRESIWTYLERELQLNEWVATLRSLLERARANDSAGLNEFLTAVDAGTTRFWQQKRNADQRAKDLGETLSRSLVRSLLSCYTEYYEIDFGLWVLGVLAKSYKDGKVTTSAFGGPESAVAQGSLIDAVSGAVSGTPLEDLLKSAYSRELRNAIGHNDYSIDVAANGAVVTDTRSGQRWDLDEIYQMMVSTNGFLEAVHTVLAYERQVIGAGLDIHKGVGTVSAAYYVIDDEPMVILFQLWCFHRIDPSGAWLDQAEMTVDRDSSGEEAVRFTESAWTKGEAISNTEFGKRLAERGWVRVLRVPVAPDLGLGYPSFIRPDDARYCIIGESDVHVVPFAGFRDHDHPRSS